MPHRRVFATAVVASFAAMTGSVASAAGFVADGPAIVKAADWNAMQTLTVTFDEHSYEPRQIALKAGQPYRIQLRNVGEKDHYYVAPEFFRAVAWRKLMVNKQAEIKVDYVNAVEVLKKNGQLDLFLVPVHKGEYHVHCNIEDHKDLGMHGTIVVE